MEFNPTDKTVAVETYSPYLDKSMTDADNKFTLDNFPYTTAARTHR